MTDRFEQDALITEEWLKSVGFKWTRFERQPDKHWLLWLGAAVRENSGDGRSLTSYEDIGIEVAAGTLCDGWFCWLRSDSGSLYGRFIHLRHVKARIELMRIVEAITGQPWTPEFHIFGSCRGTKGAAAMRDWAKRADVQIMVERIAHGASWHDLERDPFVAGANSQHLVEFVKMSAEKY